MISPWLLLILGCAGTHRYPDGTGIEGQLEREVVALKLRINELESMLDGVPITREANPLVAELHQVFADSGVLVTPAGRGARLTVSTSAVFRDPVILGVREESTLVFDLLATAIRKHEELDVHIIGHTSDRQVPSKRGRPTPTPVALTLNQARGFVEHLSATFDVPLDRFYVTGRGPFSPITSNDLPVGQDANERLEILLVPSPHSD